MSRDVSGRCGIAMSEDWQTKTGGVIWFRPFVRACDEQWNHIAPPVFVCQDSDIAMSCLTEAPRDITPSRELIRPPPNPQQYCATISSCGSEGIRGGVCRFLR